MQVQPSSLEYFKRCLTDHFADFKGRARRAEYWNFVLWNFILQLAAGVVLVGGAAVLGETGGFLGMGLYYLLALALFIPGLAVGIRRLHDTNRSGWWILIGAIPLIGAIVLIVFMATEGTRGRNNYGPDPKQVGSDDVIDALVA